MAQLNIPESSCASFISSSRSISSSVWPLGNQWPLSFSTSHAKNPWYWEPCSWPDNAWRKVWTSWAACMVLFPSPSPGYDRFNEVSVYLLWERSLAWILIIFLEKLQDIVFVRELVKTDVCRRSFPQRVWLWYWWKRTCRCFLPQVKRKWLESEGTDGRHTRPPPG